jgi:hypothetical protein
MTPEPPLASKVIVCEEAADAELERFGAASPARTMRVAVTIPRNLAFISQV